MSWTLAFFLWQALSAGSVGKVLIVGILRNAFVIPLEHNPGVYSENQAFR